MSLLQVFRNNYPNLTGVSKEMLAVYAHLLSHLYGKEVSLDKCLEYVDVDVHFETWDFILALVAAKDYNAQLLHHVFGAYVVALDAFALTAVREDRDKDKVFESVMKQVFEDDHPLYAYKLALLACCRIALICYGELLFIPKYLPAAFTHSDLNIATASQAILKFCWTEQMLSDFESNRSDGIEPWFGEDLDHNGLLDAMRIAVVLSGKEMPYGYALFREDCVIAWRAFGHRLDFIFNNRKVTYSRKNNTTSRLSTPELFMLYISVMPAFHSYGYDIITTYEDTWNTIDKESAIEIEDCVFLASDEEVRTLYGTEGKVIYSSAGGSVEAIYTDKSVTSYVPYHDVETTDEVFKAYKRMRRRPVVKNILSELGIKLPTGYYDVAAYIKDIEMKPEVI